MNLRTRLSSAINHFKGKLASRPLPNKAALIIYKLGAISEEARSASWYSGIEYIVWERIVNWQDYLQHSDYEYVFDDDLLELAELAMETGYWAYWDDDKLGPRNVDLVKWEAMFQRWKNDR